MQEILQLLSNIFGFGAKVNHMDILFAALMLWYFVYSLNWIFKNEDVSKHFSDQFRVSLLWVGFILLFAAINQGQAASILQELRSDWVVGLFFTFGSWLGWAILSILVNYIVRLFFPLFKWIHKKSQ